MEAFISLIKVNSEDEGWQMVESGFCPLCVQSAWNIEEPCRL